MSDWRTLFASGNYDAVRLEMRVAQKHGRDLLVLPPDSRVAARAMDLYPAQTPLARAARAALKLALRAGIPVPLRRERLSLARESDLFSLVRELSGGADLPRFAILCGNPDAAGRRFVVLVFDTRGEPAAIAKIGIDSAARELIDREAKFLAEAIAQPGLPRVVAKRDGSAFSVLALDFINGAAARANDGSAMGALLLPWIDVRRELPLREIPAWQRLVAAAGEFAPSLDALGARRVRPTLFHGDFAPWNVRWDRVSGRWVAIDWERSESVGVPCWDWFHWLVHVSLLVRRERGSRCFTFINRALEAADFSTYAQTAGCAGIERKLLAAYLLYLEKFIAPEAIRSSVAQLRATAVRWL